MEEIFRLRDYEPLWNEWVVDKQVCEGNLSNVYEVKNEKKTAIIKVISVPKLQIEGRAASQSNMENQEAMSGFFKDVVEALETELERISVLNNIPNILGYQQYEAFERRQDVGYDLVLLMDKEESLSDYLKKNNQIKNDGIVKLIREAAWILEQAHREGIIHKDLKPENIFVKENGECMVGDFAMARKVDSYQSRNQRKIEPAYIAPEVLSDYDYDVSTDIYALGVVLYALLNDQYVPGELINRRFQTKVPRPVRAGERLSELVLKAIAYRKNERFSSAEEFFHALSQLTEQDFAYPSSYVSEEEKKRRREEEAAIRKARLEREKQKREEAERKREEEQKKIQEQKELERKQKEIEEAKAREEQLARELEEKRLAKEPEEEAKRREEALAKAREEEAKRKEEELIRAREEAKRKEEELAKARAEEAKRKEEELAKKQQIKEEQKAEKQRKIEEKQRIKREEKEQRENIKKQRKEERQQKRKNKIEELKNTVRKGKEARAKQKEEKEKCKLEQTREREEERLQKEQQRKEVEERERQERERKEAEERERQERERKEAEERERKEKERKEAEERERQEKERKEAEERERQEKERKEAEERERQEKERKEAEERERQEKERREAEKRKEQEEVRIREAERQSVSEQVSQNAKEEKTIDRRYFEPGKIFTNYTSLDEEKNLDEYFEKNFVSASEKNKSRKEQEQEVDIDQTPFDTQTLMENMDETDREEPVYEIHSKAEEYCGFFNFEAEEFKEKEQIKKDLYDKNMEEEPFEQKVVKFEDEEGNNKIWLIIVLFLVLGGLGVFAWNNDKVRQGILDNYHKVMASMDADSDDGIEEAMDSEKE